METRRYFMSKMAYLLSALGIASSHGCKHTAHETLLGEVRDLLRKEKRSPHIPETGRWIYVEPYGHNGHFTLVAGVWIDERLIYEAQGTALGAPPAGEDVFDHNPGIPDSVFSACKRCGRSWKWVDGHSTKYSATSGFFPLCESCWRKLTPQARLPYYRAAWDRNIRELKKAGFMDQARDEEREWELVEAAVLAGR